MFTTEERKDVSRGMCQMTLEETIKYQALRIEALTNKLKEYE